MFLQCAQPLVVRRLGLSLDTDGTPGRCLAVFFVLFFLPVALTKSDLTQVDKRRRVWLSFRFFSFFGSFFVVGVTLCVVCQFQEPILIWRCAVVVFSAAACLCCLQVVVASSRDFWVAKALEAWVSHERVAFFDSAQRGLVLGFPHGVEMGVFAAAVAAAARVRLLAGKVCCGGVFVVTASFPIAHHRWC